MREKEEGDPTIINIERGEPVQVSLSDIRHQYGGTTHTSDTPILHSGNCSYKFQFRLVGLERINVLFNELKEAVATNNLETVPKNVTLRKDAVKAPDQAVDQKSSKMKDGFTWVKGKMGLSDKAQEPPDLGMPSILKKAIALFKQEEEDSEETKDEKSVSPERLTR